MTPPVSLDAKALHGLIGEIARREPDRVAVRDGGLALTFFDLWTRAGELSGALRERGMKPGEIVAVALPRSADLVIACFAVLRAGGVVLALDLHSPDARNRRFVEGSRARWSIVSPSQPAECVAATTMLDAGASGLRESPGVPVRGEDPGFLVFTSGSSGEPKGVLLSHEALTARSHGEYAAYDFTRQDSYLLRVSPSLIGLSVGLEILAAGVSVVIAADGSGEDVRVLARLIHDERVTFAGLSPRLIESLLALPDFVPELASLRVLRSSGETLSRDLAARFKAALPRCRLVDGYGATETGGVIALGEMGESGEARAASVMPGFTLRLVAEDGSPANEGEIQAASRMLATGYLGGEDAGEPKFILAPDPGGSPRRWYRTGDRGRLTEGGGLHVLGRLDLQLNVNGVRVDPVEIEKALRLHPSVRDAAAWTHADAVGRARLTAYIVDRGPSASPLTLRTFLAETLPPSLIPVRFVHLEALPLTASDKVDRARLPQPAPPPSASREAGSPLEAELLTLFRNVLEAPGLGIDADFFEWGGDSLKAFALMSRIADHTGVRLPASAILEAPTVEALAKEVARGDPGEVSATWLRKDGDLPPLACVPGLAGDPLWFFPLVDALDPRQPMLGLSLVGLKPPISISVAASRGVAALRTVQPRGPYLLLGHSVGGVLAFEMARELASLGEAVAFVGLIDTYVPGSDRIRPAEGSARLAHGLKRFRNRMLGVARRSLGESLSRFGLKGERSGPVFIPGLREAAVLHRLSPCELRVTLFRASERSRGADLAADWAPLARGGVEVIDIAGHHFNVVTGGRARELSAKVAGAVARALTSWSRETSSRSA